ILAVAAFVLIRTLGKGKGWLKYLLYALNLSAMSALCVGSGSLVCMLGALAFLFSDGMIALDSLGVRTSKKISEMSLYILAQLLLVLGFTTL
ncbi:MAG: lysoplasmalogenase family protein, partial [Sphaerochaeta sp.]